MKIEQYFDEKLGKKLWRIDVTVDGERFRPNGIPTRKKCVDMIAELRMDARLRRLGLLPQTMSVTLANLVQERLADPSTKRKPLLKVALRALYEVISPNALATELDASHLKKLETLLIGRKLAAGTINNYLAVLSAMFKESAIYFPDELGKYQWPKIPWQTADEGRQRVLSADEISRILRALLLPRQPWEHKKSIDHRDDVGDAIRLALLLAARENEILDLKSSDVNWDWKVIKLKATKTNKTRILPMTQTVIDLVQPRYAEGKTLFPPDFTDIQLQYWCQDAGRRAGIPWGREIENGWTFHDLRRTSATIIETNGTPYSAVSAVLGHKRSDKTAIYTIARQTDIQQAMLSVERWCQEIDGFSLRFSDSSDSINEMQNRQSG